MTDYPNSQDLPGLLRGRFGRDGWPPDTWDSADFLHGFGDVPGALLYATLFVPEFVEVEGCIFLKELGARLPGGWSELAQRAQAARAVSGEALRRLVWSCTWLEVPYLFSNHSGSDEACGALAALLVEAWRARLHDLFPDRHFVVRIITSEESGGTVGVGFEEEIPG